MAKKLTVSVAARVVRLGGFSWRVVGVAAVLAMALAGGRAQGGLLAIDWNTGDLYQVSTTDASLTLVGSTGITEPASLDFRQSDGTLFTFTSRSSSTLYSINPATAAATAVGPLGVGFVFEGGLAIAPDGTAYGTNQGSSSACALFAINLTTGAATNIGVIGTGAHDFNGLTWRSDGRLVGLDRVTNSLLTIDPNTAAVATLAALTPTVGSLGGMAYDGLNYYYAIPGVTSATSLYSLDINTGASTFIGSNSMVTAGLAGYPDEFVIPEPATLSLLGLGLLSIARRRCKC